jgi:hypothetical protein
MSLPKVRHLAGTICVTLAIGIAVFQLTLLLGFPLGKAAWGGSSANLSLGLRICSGVSAFLWIVFAPIFATRAGFRDPAETGISILCAVRTTWAVFGLMCLGCVMNWASPSRIERFIWGPVTTVFVVSLFFLAQSKRPEERRALDFVGQRNIFPSAETPLVQ